MQPFVALLVDTEDEIMASLAAMCESRRPNMSVSILDPAQDAQAPRGSCHSHYRPLAVALHALDAPNLVSGELALDECIRPEPQQLEEEIWRQYKVDHKTHKVVSNAQPKDAGLLAAERSRKRRVSKSLEDDEGSVAASSPKRRRKGQDDGAASGSDKDIVHIIKRRMAELQAELEAMGARKVRVELEEEELVAGDNLIEVSLSLNCTRGPNRRKGKATSLVMNPARDEDTSSDEDACQEAADSGYSDSAVVTLDDDDTE